MSKARRKDSTQPTRHETSRHGGSSIRNEEAYIRETKARLGDGEALQDHAMRHEPDAANPCTLKNCRERLRWALLEMLKHYETVVPIAPDLRELHAAVTDGVSAAERCVSSLDRLIPRVSDADFVRSIRNYFDAQREANEMVKSLVFASVTRHPSLEILAEEPLHRFRGLAIRTLGFSGHSYQEIADLVDEGDRDRTRNSPAWQSVVNAFEKQGKRPPGKRRNQRARNRQPDTATSTEPAETPPVANSAQAE